MEKSENTSKCLTSKPTRANTLQKRYTRKPMKALTLEEGINTYGGCYNYNESTSLTSIFVTPHTYQKYYQY